MGGCILYGGCVFMWLYILRVGLYFIGNGETKTDLQFLAETINFYRKTPPRYSCVCKQEATSFEGDGGYMMKTS